MARRGRSDDAPIVVASAAAVRLFEENPEELSDRAKRIGYALAWQHEAWKWYGRLGEVWYSHAWKGSAIGGLHWLIGTPDSKTGDLVPARGVDGVLAAGVDEQLFQLAQDALDRLVGPNGSHSEWARPLGTAISCVAEGWLLGYHVDDEGNPVDGTVGEGDFAADNPEAIMVVWDACSPTELDKVNGEDGKPRLRVQRTAEGDPTTLPRDALAVRIWRRHPRWSEDADGPMEPLIDVCEDLYLLRMSVRGSALSRTHAGLLLIPTEGLGQPLSAYANQQSGGAASSGQGPPPNPVITEIIAGLATPHRDPASAAAVVPTAITTKGDHIEKWKHLPLTRDIDPMQKEQREELIRAYATGIDLPPERLLGMADLNHWTAWQVGEDSWRHVDPDARCIAGGLSAGYLWPDMIAALEEADPTLEITAEVLERVRAFRITYDPTPVIISPDRSEDADAALAAGAISWAAYRRYKHIPETDAPTVEELEERALLGFGGRPPTPAGGPGDVVEGPAQSAQPGADTAASVRAAIRARQTVRASLRVTGQMERYARACARIETGFLRDVLLAVDASVDEAVRKAQARLRSLAQRDSQLRARIAGVPNCELVTIIGRREVARLRATFEGEEDVTAEGLFAGTLALLLARYHELSTAARREWLRVTNEMLGLEFEADELAALEADLIASGPVLQTGARQAAEAAFLGGAAASVLLDGPGEVPAGVRIPPVVVRRAAARAGGAPIAGGIAPMEAGWEGGLTSGPTIAQFLERRGFVAVGLVWDYGSPTSRKDPYLPHLELSGVEAAALEDYLGFYPGDHGGCQCTIGRLYATDDGDEAKVTSLDPAELP